MTDDLLAAAAEITLLRAAVLCGDCPPVGYSTDATRCRSCPRLPSSAQAPEGDAFAVLCRTYVQRADDRQRAMGLQYTEAETHDLAKVMERYARAAAQAERAGIVAFLREGSATHHRIATSFKSSGDRDGASTHVSMSHTYGCAADAIERGEDKS